MTIGKLGKLHVGLQNSGRQNLTLLSMSDKILFYGKNSEIADGKMPNILGDDWLTVTGSAGSETFQCPNTAPYIAADTDNIWFTSIANQRTVTFSEAIGYDFQRTIFKYDSYDPFHIREIVILKEDAILTKRAINILMATMDINPWWLGVWNNYGSIKENRAFEQTLWMKKSLHGRLYNWYAIAELAPAGWHVPSQTEITTMRTYLGGISVSLPKVKEVGLEYWIDPNTGTNESGFTALGSGTRSSSDFETLKETLFLWTTTNGTIGGTKKVYSISSLFVSTDYAPTDGCSIRLVRDNLTGYVSEEQLIDDDGNIYDTVQIGTQVWLKQNWACTKLANGTPIPNVTDNTAWTQLVTGAYCNYNNDESYVFQ